MSSDFETRLAQTKRRLANTTRGGPVDVFNVSGPHLAELVAEIERLRVDAGRLAELCRDALAEELAAWDLDPPLHHVKEAHDACVAWLAKDGAR